MAGGRPTYLWELVSEGPESPGADALTPEDPERDLSFSPEEYLTGPLTFLRRQTSEPRLGMRGQIGWVGYERSGQTPTGR